MKTFIFKSKYYTVTLQANSYREASKMVPYGYRLDSISKPKKP